MATFQSPAILAAAMTLALMLGQQPQTPTSQPPTSDLSAYKQQDSSGSAPQTDAQPGLTITSRSTLVLVPALVKTKSGAVVYTLKADDFTLTDNGVQQKLTLEEDTGDQPLALVVLIETGGAGGRQLDLYRTLPTMLDVVVGGEPHKIAVVTFDSEPHFVQKFTPDTDRIAKTFNHIEPGDERAATLDGIAFATVLLRRQPPQFRRAILLVSETLDHGSHISLGEALRLIGDTNTVIYAVSFSSTRSDAKYESSKIIQSEIPGPPGGCMAKDPDADPDIKENELAKAFECLQILIPPIRIAKIAALAGVHGLQKNVPETVAHLTGGEFFKFSNKKSLEKDLQTISNHVPNRYVLSFHPHSPEPGIHALELQLKDYPDLKVTARSSYWADEDTSTPVGK